jgi:2',3'-cyclic-nucleotide 2'-phosphodiesterase/3'-nucleotidase
MQMRMPRVLGLMFVALAATALPLAAQESLHLVVVASTDVHGRAYHWDYLTDSEAAWGITRAATAIDSLRAEFPGRVIVLDAGDLIQGNPFALYFARERDADPHPLVDALNAAGYDAATPGNHELDFGVDFFLRAISGAAFPIVSANLFRMPRDTFLFSPYAILQRGGARVGVTGLTTPGVMVWHRQKVAGRIEARRVVPAAERVMGAMDSAGAHVRIAIAHSGLGSASSYDTTGIGAENDAASLASLAIKPHLVVVGHSHGHFVDSLINGVHFIQPQARGRSLAVAHVWLVGEPGAGNREGGVGSADYRVVRIEGEEIPLAGVRPHSVVSRRLERAHQAVRVWVATPLAVIDSVWSGQYARAGDTPLIDFLNEVQRRTAGADLSATAAFDTRARFGPGEVHMRAVAALYPYENTLKAVRIDGQVLKQYLEQSASYFGRLGEPGGLIRDSIPGYNLDIVSGVEYVIDLSRPVGSRILQLAREGRLVQPNDSFTLAINDYRQKGGGGFQMLRGLPLVYDGEQHIRDVLIDWIRATDTLRARDYFVPSWSVAPPAAEQALRAHFGPPEEMAPRAVARLDPTVAVFAPLDTARPEPPPPAAPVANVKFALQRGDSEHALGRLVADGVKNGARTHFALVPNRSIVNDLPGGPVTAAEVTAVLAADEPLVRLTITGRTLFDLLEHVVGEGAPIVHVAGFEVWFDPERDAGRRVRALRLPDGQDIERSTVYSLAVPATVAYAASGFSMLGELESEPAGITCGDALLSYLTRLRQPVDAPASSRFHVVR